MFRKIMRNNRFLVLTGILVQQTDAEKLRKASEEFHWEQGKDSSNILGINSLGLGRNSEEEQRQKKKELGSKLSGWDRVKTAFLAMNKDEKLCPELCFSLHLAETGVLSGIAYGGVKGYIKALNLFLESNDTSKFFNAKEAKIALIKTSMRGFFKGALLTAPKTAVLCAIFGVSNAVLALHNDKNGILEFSLAGAITTGLMKWNLGMRGMLSGSITGGVAGLFMGSMITIVTLYTGKSFSDFQYLWYSVHHSKKNANNENEIPSSEAEIEKYYIEKTQGLPVAFSDN